MRKLFRNIVYPGTFDPLTKGHEDLILRASKIFDVVTVAVADGGSKSPYFSLTDRVLMARDCLRSIENVSVDSFSGLLVEFLKANNFFCVLRGIRTVSDFEYETQLAEMNRDLYEKIETVFLTPEKKYMFLSSSMVREIANHGGDVSAFVSPAVLQCFNRK